MSEPEIIVYGGAFDPPHQGHVDCVRVALERFPNAIIYVIPAGQPAGAAGRHKTPDASFEHRLALCETAFTGLDDERVRVLPLEAKLPPPNYTVKTLEHLSERIEGRRLGLLMGQDQLDTFHKWHDYEGILARAALVVVKRDSATAGFGGILKDSAERLAERLGDELQWKTPGAQAQLQKSGGTLFLINVPVSVAASTEIRDFLTRGRPLPDGWMPPSVQRYIADHALYGSEEGTRS